MADQLAALGDLVQSLHEEGRLRDPVALVFVAAAQGAAEAVDVACAPDSDVPFYAQVRCRQAYGGALRDLVAHVGTPPPPPDKWAQLFEDAEREAAELAYVQRTGKLPPILPGEVAEITTPSADVVEADEAAFDPDAPDSRLEDAPEPLSDEDQAAVWDDIEHQLSEHPGVWPTVPG